MEGICMWSGKHLNRSLTGFQLYLRKPSVKSILQDSKQMTEVAKAPLSELISNLDQIRTIGGLITRWLCQSHM